MKILIATGLYPPQMGGPATYAVFLEKHLSVAGIGFSVLPYRIVQRYPKILRHVLYTYELIRAGRSHDILYALDTVSVGLPTMIASLILGKRFLLRVPGDYAWEQGQQRFNVSETLDEYLVSKKHVWKVKVLALIQYYVALYATKIIVPSEYMRKIVTQWGINPKKISRIYSALKVVDITESREKLRAELNYGGFVIVTAARLVPWKGVQVLIDAIIHLRISGLPVSFHIFGEGALRETLIEYVTQKNASDYIRFMGVVERTVLAKYISAADVFVLNTSYEGLSHQLLEVMSLKTPIITTPVGGNTELIVSGEHGLLVPFNDRVKIINAITELYNNTSLRLRLTDNAAQKVTLFHEDIVFQEFKELLKSL